MELPITFRYKVHVGPRPHSEIIRVLRAMDQEYQADVVGISGEWLGLRCRDEKGFDAWMEQWKLLTD